MLLPGGHQRRTCDERTHRAGRGDPADQESLPSIVAMEDWICTMVVSEGVPLVFSHPVLMVTRHRATALA